MVRTLLPLLTALLLSACTNAPERLGISNTYCCGAPRAQFDGYRLELGTMPGFLAPYVEDALRAALYESGLSERADARLVARVDFDQLEDEPRGHADDFEGHLEAGGDVSFTTRLTLRLIDRPTGTEVLRGALSRHHHISPGDHMHGGRARLSMYNGFRELLRPFAAP